MKGRGHDLPAPEADILLAVMKQDMSRSDPEQSQQQSVAHASDEHCTSIRVAP